jgi:hypothetical protein
MTRTDVEEQGRRDNERERRGRLKPGPQEPGAAWFEGYDLHIHGTKTTWVPPALRRLLFRLRRPLGLLRDYPF